MLRNQKKGNGRSSVAAVVPLGDLSLNPVVVAVAGDGATSQVTVTRLKGAHMRVSCDCEPFAREAWCQHCVDVVSLQTPALSGLDTQHDKALRQLVSGLPLASEARQLVVMQQAFAASLKKFDAERPPGIAAEQLGLFTELVSDLAVVSSELEDAIGRFQRRMETWKTLPAADQSSGATS